MHDEMTDASEASSASEAWETMDPAALFAQARSAGVTMRRNGDRLRVEGPHELESLGRALIAHKPAIMAILAREEAEIGWRVEAMRPQVPARGPIPFLMARPGLLAHDAPGRCASCGGPLTAGGGTGQRLRCRWCVTAAQRALGVVREGLGGVDDGEGKGMREG